MPPEYYSDTDYNQNSFMIGLNPAFFDVTGLFLFRNGVAGFPSSAAIDRFGYSFCTLAEPLNLSETLDALDSNRPLCCVVDFICRDVLVAAGDRVLVNHDPLGRSARGG